MEDGRKKRLLRNFFVRPKQQFKLTFLMLSVGILAMIIVTAYFMYYLNALDLEMKIRDPMSAVLLEQFISPMFRTIIIGQIVLWVFSVLIGVVITHRIYGPLIPILRHIRSLISGDYTSRVHLRGSDELDEVASALNELADKLQKK